MGVVEVLDPVTPTRVGGLEGRCEPGERNGRVSSEWFNRPDDERYLSLDDSWGQCERPPGAQPQPGGADGGYPGRGRARQPRSVCT